MASPHKVPPKKIPKPPKVPPAAPPAIPPIASDPAKPSEDAKKPPDSLQSTVQTHRPGSRQPFGVPWRNVSRWEPAFVNAGVEFGVDPRLMRAMALIESDANQYDARGQVLMRDDGFGDGYSVGLMQVKPRIWQSLVPDADAYTAIGNIRLGTAIMAKAIKDQGSWQKAITNVYFPANDPNGTTQQMYVDTVASLLAEQGGTTPAPPSPPPLGDVLDLLFGGRPYDVTADYGQLVTWSCPGCYDYFTAYGLDSAHHWAYDASARAGDGAPLYAPFDGKVVCAGTDNGPGAWGTGCAAFPRVNNYGGKPAGVGAGRLEILHADGTKSLIIGHVLSSRVHPGDLVKQGDLIGQQGGMNASHAHCEGRYANGTRIGDPRVLFGGGPMPVERIPYDFDTDPNLFTVKALQPLKVYQRADLSAPVLDTIAAGETFDAVAVIPGNDGRPWYLGKLNGRVPLEGTDGPVQAA